MAYPALIQKILDLRQDMQNVRDEQCVFSTALVGLAEQSIRMSARVVDLELEKAESNVTRMELAERISGLELDSNAYSEAHTELARENIRMSGRIAALELDDAKSLTSRVEIAERVSSLELDSLTHSESHVSLASECVRMSDRLVDQELGAEHPNLAPVLSTYCDPEGYDLFSGAKVAPVTIVNDGQPTHRGAALTVVLDEIYNH